MNLVVLIGRLIRDPELRYTQTGLAVARFSLAVDRRFAKKDESNAATADFFNVVVFGKIAETASEYLQKGRLAGIRGRLQNNNYTDKDAIKRYNVDVVADEVQFLDRGDKKTSGESMQRGSQDSQKDDEFMPEGGLDEDGFRAPADDDVPF